MDLVRGPSVVPSSGVARLRVPAVWGNACSCPPRQDRTPDRVLRSPRGLGEVQVTECVEVGGSAPSGGMRDVGKR